jgi:hypothetical protein
MKKLTVFFALISLFLPLAAMAQDAPTKVFPFADGYTAGYAATQGATTWNCEIQFTGTTKLQGVLWLVMQLTDWTNGSTTDPTFLGGTSLSADVRTTADALYEYDSTLSTGKPPYSIPLFEQMKVGKSWTYTDSAGNSVTATVESIGPVTVPAGTYEGVYAVQYASTVQSEIIYWKPGVGLIKDVDSSPGLSAPITRELTTHPVAELLVGTWTGNMRVVTASTTSVETGTVQVMFDQVGNTTQAYTGSLSFTPGGGGSPINLTLTAIRGPFDPTLVHITSAGYVILGEMRKQAGYWVLDLHGSDITDGYTLVSLGLTKE